MMKKRKITMLFLAIAIIFSCFLTCFAPTTIQSVSASSIGVVGGYTNVLEDLQKDETFNADDFPVVADDYSLSVMELAESSDKQLFVYVYQPCAEYKNLVATSLFLSTSEKGLDYKNYYLTLINNHGVFYKYRVDNFFVGSAEQRHYEITSIYRAFDEKLDTGLSDDNENMIDEVNFKVAKHWIFDNNGIVQSSDIETIKIVDKYVGFIRYKGGSNWWGVDLWQDSHFVAFTTDRQIDQLIDADIYFQTQSRYEHHAPLDFGADFQSYVDLGEIKDGYSYVHYEDSKSYDSGKPWNSYHYTWKRIQKVDEFIASENRSDIYECGVLNRETESTLTDEGLTDIKDKQWILRFYETSFEQQGNSIGETGYEDTYSTIVSNVSILRLKFLTANVTYNLGVIDNKQSGDGTPDNVTTEKWSFTDEFKVILALLFLIVLVIILAPILPTIFNVVVAIVKILFKIIIWVITAPFKLIGAIFKKPKD